MGRARSLEVIRFFREFFLYNKNSGASLLNFGPFGAGSLGEGKLAEFLRGCTAVFMT